MFFIGLIFGIMVGAGTTVLINELLAAKQRRENEAEERLERQTRIGFVVTQTYEERVAARKRSQKS